MKHDAKMGKAGTWGPARPWKQPKRRQSRFAWAAPIMLVLAPACGPAKESETPNELEANDAEDSPEPPQTAQPALPGPAPVKEDEQGEAEGGAASPAKPDPTGGEAGEGGGQATKKGEDGGDSSPSAVRRTKCVTPVQLPNLETARLRFERAKELEPEETPALTRSKQDEVCTGLVEGDTMVFHDSAFDCVMERVTEGGPLHALWQGGDPIQDALCLEKVENADEGRGLRFSPEKGEKKTVRVRDTGDGFELLDDFIYWDGDDFQRAKKTLPSQFEDEVCESPETAEALIAVGRGEDGYTLGSAGFKIEPNPEPPASPGSNSDWCDGEDKDSDGLGPVRTCTSSDPVCTICVDLTGGTPRIIQTAPRNVLRPNQGIRLVVKHDKGTTADLEVDGDPALTVPEAVRSDKESVPGTLAPANLAGSPNGFLVTTHPYAPRKPGKVTLEASSKRETTCEDARDETKVKMNFIVDTLSWGAVRVGVGSVFLDAASPEYEIRTLPGSNQPEIVETADLGVNFEVVLGFSPYLIPDFSIFAWPLGT